MEKRVAIVGAGPCGLVALKETVEAGHDATLFERSSSLGGVFASAAVYPNLHLTISNWAMAFSDFPDEALLHYPTAEHYLRYLQRYAKHFDLERHIQYNTEVESAHLNAEGQWDIATRHQNRQTEEHTFDALIVATGANQVPKPTPPALSGFTGRIIHSSQYDSILKQEVRDKQLHVLIVGGGESGADISAELSALSPNVTVWLRRPMCVGPRYLNDKSEVEQMELNKKEQLPANGFLEAATTGRLSAKQSVYTYGFFRRLLWRAPVLNKTLGEMCLRSTDGAWVMNDQATYVTKNQRMCEALHDGKLEVLVAPEVSAAGNKVRFGSETHREMVGMSFDGVVNCTGFTTSFPWLKVEGLQQDNPRKWWLHCFPPGLGEKLFFVGYARPHQGGIPVMAEMLSRYIAMLLKGHRQLPPDYAALAKRDETAEREHYHLSPDLHSLVDYNAFLESVARRIGCEPRIPTACILAYNVHVVCAVLVLASFIASHISPFSTSAAVAYMLSIVPLFTFHNGLLLKWWFYPHWSVWYRQRGVGSNTASFTSTLDQVSIWKATAITRGFILLLLWSIPMLYTQYVVNLPLYITNKIMQATGLRFGRRLGGLLRPKMFVLHEAEWRWLDLFMP